jgi:hypothetical protein
LSKEICGDKNLTENPEPLEERKSSFTPLIVSAGVALLLSGLVFFLPLAIGGAVILAVGIFQLFRDGSNEKFADFKESLEEK